MDKDTVSSLSQDYTADDLKNTILDDNIDNINKIKSKFSDFTVIKFFLSDINIFTNVDYVFKNSNRYHLVKYEDLVANPKGTFNNILLFIRNIAWNHFFIDPKRIEKVVDQTNFSKLIRPSQNSFPYR